MVLSMVASCSLNTLLTALHVIPQMAPGYMGVLVYPPKEGKENPNREEATYGDFWITDKQPRTDGFVTKIHDDKSPQQQFEFPMGW